MSTTDRRDQLSRLLQLLLAMRSGHPNAEELAELCEVSRRTIYRDLAALELAGVPIRYRPERHGYEIAASFLLPTPQLNRREAVALAITARLRAADQAFLGRDARQAIGKVLSALPAAERQRIEEIGRLIEVPDGVDSGVAELGNVSTTVFEALSSRRALRAWFRRGASIEGDELDDALIGPYRMVLARHGWQLLGRWFGSPPSVVTLGLTSIRRAELIERPYSTPHETEVRRWITRAGLAPPPRGKGLFVRLRVNVRDAARFPEGVWHPSVRGDDWTVEDRELTLVADSAEDVLALIADPGDGIEVLAPPELRRRWQAQARRVAGERKEREPRLSTNEIL